MSADIGSPDGPAARIRGLLEGPNTYGNSPLFWGFFVVVVAGLAVYPMTTDPFSIQTTTQYFALAFLALSLSVVWGYCGILSFGQVAFFGVAAYTFGVIGINFGTAGGITAALLGAIVVGALFAAALGYFMFYGGVRDVYVTIITLVVALVLNTFAAQTAGSEWAIGEARLGGFNGMPDIPDLVLGVGGASVAFDRVAFYYLLLAALVVTYLGLRAFVNSGFGMTMVAVREDEARTETFGYNVPFIKLVVFTIGGALAAAGGVFYAVWGNFIDPSVFGILFAALPVVWVSVGGRESLIGAIGATFAIEWMRTGLTDGVGPLGPEWAFVIIGGLLMVVILVMPAGIVPYLDRGLKQLLERINDRSTTEPTEGATE
ncbi:ABC-type transport system permease protein (probable substrate urea/short-chain amides) [Natronomonas pharaonis DSM 2160]|uniref:ABC-type transport system permease protein (Probable substrate urea/short-chain amides) n=1 Tax=Natronomonas pharaonis (strain ATCC 35678 / DSM 2160 / CIP 103997 / JCM 8858 / NBRC 14720 / NCIMB 2260 / Gabara) TaxID=348780 RepID=A0A1U7EVM6_NATPD|nr:urea ABC transporter, permease protein UrtC [Natronomonas pharaonis]CAI49091.1 ABC-type transport system permease protein (probable substrate urea/short-chain amides) [Natronomonas pharaonis DSM 2160]